MSAKPKKLTQEVVRELLDYDETTGTLIWRHRDRRFFTSDRIWKSWNSKHAGRPAFTGRDTSGHVHGRIFGKLYRAHRVIYCWMTGRWPPMVDHENRDRADNRWPNLRHSTDLENAQNRTLNRNNASGVCGVHYQDDAGFVAAIAGEYLGCFESLEEAASVRFSAQCERGFAEGHGAPRLQP